MIGKTISHYKILEKLGEGGMGVVYKAQDTKLNRRVALKFLPAQLSSDQEFKVRFQREAQAAAALNHPNVVTVYEVSEFESRPFIAMEYVEGESLKDLIAKKELSIDQTLDISLQISEGLVVAHKAGIMHRDIKPQNVLLGKDGRVKICDFGLAKLRTDITLTQTGSTLGTVAYMSPEQAQGKEADHRSDIFSFGVVIYEMIAGRLPFNGKHEAATVYSIVNETPEPLARYKANVPGELQRIVDKTLTKEKGERYQHIDEVLADLKSIRRKLETTATIHKQSKAKSLKKTLVYISSSLAIFIILLILLKIFFFTPHRETIDSLAVLPLQNLSGDVNQEYFSDGMTEALITELQKIRSLRVISRTSVMRYKKSEELLPEIAKKLKVKAVVEGSVLREGDMVRINIQLIQASPEKHLWASSFDKPMKNILALQSEVAQAIAQEVKAVVTPEEQTRLESSRPIDPEAHEAYLKGRFYWNKRRGDDLKTAVEYFNKAIDKDSGYALAYAGLASAYVSLPGYSGLPDEEYIAKADIAAKKALELDPAIGEAHAVLGVIKDAFNWDWAGAEIEYKRAIELDPGSPTVHQWYSDMLHYVGKLEESLAEARRAQELDPLSLVINATVGHRLYVMRQYEKARDEYRRILELDADFPLAHQYLGMVYEVQGKFDEAIQELKKARTLYESGFYALSDLGYCYARTGKTSEASKILDELFIFSKQGVLVSAEIAFVYYGLGDKDKTFEWFERAYQERTGGFAWVFRDPVFDSLHSDPRFIALLENMRLEK